VAVSDPIDHDHDRCTIHPSRSDIIIASMSQPSHDLLVAFRTVYHQFEQAIRDVLLNPTDSTILAQLGDDLDEFAVLAIQAGQTQL
jgi:hypothetical protein